jgi:hypothetical protein
LSHVDPKESLTRYIVEKSYYRSTDETVRHNAFMPPANNRALSVFRISDLPQDEVWDLGELYVAAPRNKLLLGRADIFASNVFSKGLGITPTHRPHPRHANIINWPVEREYQRMIAVELAAEARLHLMR